MYLTVLLVITTKLRVEVQQGEDECQPLIVSQSEEGDKAEDVVETEWCQHHSCHLVMTLKVTADVLIIIWVRTIIIRILRTLRVSFHLHPVRPSVTLVSSSVQFVDEHEVGDDVSSGEEDVQHQDDPECLVNQHQDDQD